MICIRGQVSGAVKALDGLGRIGAVKKTSPALQVKKFLSPYYVMADLDFKYIVSGTEVLSIS